jgi:hypothetical protein
MASDWYGPNRLAASTALNTSRTARNAANSACHLRRLPALMAVPRTKNTLAQPPTSATVLGVYRTTSLVLTGVFPTNSEGVRLAKDVDDGGAGHGDGACGQGVERCPCGGRARCCSDGRGARCASSSRVGAATCGARRTITRHAAAISAAAPCKSHGSYHLPYLLSSFTTWGSCAPHPSRIGPGHRITFRGS